MRIGDEERALEVLRKLGIKFHFKLGQEVRVIFSFKSRFNGVVGKIVSIGDANVEYYDIQYEEIIFTVFNGELRPIRWKDLDVK